MKNLQLKVAILALYMSNNAVPDSLRASVWSKNMGGGVGAKGPSPRSPTVTSPTA